MQNFNPWPTLSKEAFSKTSHLLHMCVQIMGKLMLTSPFDPHWANLAMPITSRGITTGVIPYQNGTFSIDIDCIDHFLIFTTTWGKIGKIKLTSMPVSDLYAKICHTLHELDITLQINRKPQEVSNPLDFDMDSELRTYDEKIVNAWWRITASTNRVLLKYHSKFYGITPRIGLFWGTLDLRDARYRGTHLKAVSNYIGRNAMDDVQFEVGWSSSNEKYLVPSFFAFPYPKPEGYEKENVAFGKWAQAINEFVLDYEDLQKSHDPDGDLLRFFESSYEAFAKLAGWDPQLIVPGEPR
jgi:hypothetical protein